MTLFQRKVTSKDIVSKHQSKATRKVVLRAIKLSVQDQKNMLQRAK